MMSTTTHTNITRIGTSATALVVLGVGLQLFVTQTLGSLSVASVILALYVAFWAYVLGSLVLVALGIWLLIKKRHMVAGSTRLRPQSHDQDGLQQDHTDVLSPKRAA